MSRPSGALRRVDLATESGGLPPSLLAAIEAAGGLWSATDAERPVADLVAAARATGAVALRLDLRDLSVLARMLEVRFLHLRSDGRPVLDPISSLERLEALIIEVRAPRGELDPLAFEHLRWLAARLGGRAGAAARAALERGHPRLEHLRVTETDARTLGELVSGFPRLRHVRVAFADRLRTLGDPGSAAASLTGLELSFVDLRSLDGIEALGGLRSLVLTGGHVTDIEPLRALPGLRYASLESAAAIASLEPLRGHPALRMLELSRLEGDDLGVLETMPELVAVGRGPRLEGTTPFPDLRVLGAQHPLVREWDAAVRG